MQFLKLMKNKKIWIAFLLVLCVIFSGCGKPAESKEEDHDVTLPIVSQGNMEQEEIPEVQIPIVSEEEAYKTMLVNITHPMPEDYAVELVVVDRIYKGTIFREP